MIQKIIREIPAAGLTIIAIALCFPAFLIHLDLIAFIGDEGIRSLVAFEMKLSGNYIMPTLNGEPYYNKPPLYNWMILMLSSLFGYFGEWPARLTTLIGLTAYAYSVYYFSKKYTDRLTAITLALMLLTSGRILFWDSMLGLIDICFSWIVWLNIMLLYHLARKKQWSRMFLLSYLLFSVAFLLKGLPAVVFQGISVITALWFHGVLRQKLFSKVHLTGIGIGVLPLAAYYAAYATQIKLDTVLAVLTDQSLQRTVTHHGIKDTVLHVFTFPFEQLYHFLPWSLLAVMFFHPKARKWIKENAFVRYNILLLLANIPVYWLSVQVYPRYLLMFVPMFNLAVYYLLSQSLAAGKRWWTIFRIVFVFFTGIALLLVVVMPVDARVAALPGIYFISGGAGLFLLIALAGQVWDSGRSFLWFAIALLVVRSVFNLVVLPLRVVEFRENRCREDCRRLADQYGDSTWYLYKNTYTHEVARFYTSAYSGQIIKKAEIAADKNAYYLVDTELYPEFEGVKVDSLLLERGQKLAFMRAVPVQ